MEDHKKNGDFFKHRVESTPNFTITNQEDLFDWNTRFTKLLRSAVANNDTEQLEVIIKEGCKMIGAPSAYSAISQIKEELKNSKT